MDSYDAFISYGHGADPDVAREVQRTLWRLGKPWYRRRALLVFRDQTNLTANPDLWGTIQQALERSRWLVVLCTPEAAVSEWVNKEIQHWRDIRGDERIILVVAGGAFRWDRGCFDGDSSAIPPALAGAFRSEPLLADLREAIDATTPSERQARFRDKLAEVSATIQGRSKDDLIGDDLREHRRAMRLAVGAVALLLVLALTASGAGILALANASQADSQRRAAEASEEQALAQAYAAEALLASDESPSLAIERVMQASRDSDSPTIRSAMIAVATAAGRLDRAVAYPEAVAGHPPVGAIFDHDRPRLIAWSPYEDDEDRSFVQVWELNNGDVRFSGSVEVAELSDVAAVSPGLLVGCSRDGPVTIDIDDTEGNVTRLDEGWVSGRGCAVGQFGGGVFARSFESSEPSRVLYVDAQGNTKTFEEVEDIGTHPAVRTAVLAGPSGIVVVSPEGVQPVTDAPAYEVATVDEHGDALVQLTASTWAALWGRADGWQLEPLPIPPDAVDVVAVRDGPEGVMTGDFAWMIPDGTVGWTRDGHGAKVLDSLGGSGDRSFRPSLRALPGETLVAVVGTTATVLRRTTASNAADVVETGDVWATIGEYALGPAAKVGDSAVLDECDHGRSLVLGANRKLLFGYGEPIELLGQTIMGPDCQVLEYNANSLSIISGNTSDTRVQIRSDAVLQGLSISATGEQVALVRPGRPIEILSTAHADSLPTSWRARQVYDEVAVQLSFGRRQVHVVSEGGVSTIVIIGGATEERVPLPSVGRLLSVRPDGAEFVWEEQGSDPSQRFAGASDARVHPDCKGASIRYQPEPGFRTSLDAAEAQIPVAMLEGGSATNCRTGDVIGDPVDLLAYDLDARQGRIVSLEDGQVRVTTWQRGDKSSLDSFVGPPTRFDNAEVTFDGESRVALVHETGSQEMTVYERDSGRWERVSDITSGLPHVADAVLADQGTLVAVVSSTGGFELHDAASGRTLASDPNLALVSNGDEVDRIAATRVDSDFLYVDLAAKPSDADGLSSLLIASATIEIPIGVAALTEQLCGIYEVTECP